ncbi:MAG: crosslink repair DNA glycosylase YcaQ family protein [Dongiaceae bacterium]
MSGPRRIRRTELVAFLLDRLGLRGPLRDGAAGAGWLPELGMVQIDSIRVTGLRNHELAWLARAEAPVAGFYRLLYEDRALRETHYPIFASRRDWLPWLWTGFADPPERWRREMQAIRPVMRKVLRHIRDNGPAGPADFAGVRVPGGFNTVKVTTKALEYLFTERVLQISGRNAGFHRLFDLTERQTPELAGWRRPRAPDYRRFLVESALAVLKVATAGQIAERAALHYGSWRGPVLKEMRVMVDRALARGAAVPVVVADLPDEPVYWYRAADEAGWERAATAVADQARIVPPLDNLLFSRRRFAQLFGLDYKFEAYTPVEERRFYFAMPLIAGDEVAGLVDARLADGAWEVRGLDLFRPVDHDALRAALHRLARHAGAAKVAAAGTLDRAVRRAVAGPLAP